MDGKRFIFFIIFGTATELVFSWRWEDCTAGQHFDMSIGECAPCPAGEFQPIPESFYCTLCPENTVPSEDKTHCVGGSYPSTCPVLVAGCRDTQASSRCSAPKQTYFFLEDGTMCPGCMTCFTGVPTTECPPGIVSCYAPSENCVEYNHYIQLDGGKMCYVYNVFHCN